MYDCWVVLSLLPLCCWSDDKNVKFDIILLPISSGPACKSPYMSATATLHVQCNCVLC